jgi:lambda family phage tail tape measure protein
MARFESTVQFAVNAQTNNVALLDDFRKKMDAVNQTAKRSASEGLSSFDSGLSVIARTISGPLAVALSGAAIAGFAKKTIDLAGKLNDASTATTVAATTLDQYRQAGEQAGVSFETITGGLGKLNKSIADAASGNQEAADAFGQLGISVTNNDGTVRKTSEIFQEFADKVRAAPDDAAIFEQGTKIFGRGFANLLPLLEQGDEGMKKFRSRFSEEGIQQLDSFGDNITNVGEGFGFLAATILQSVVPTINSFTNGIVDAREAIQDFLNTNNTLEAVLDSIAGGYIRVASAARLLYDVVNPFSGSANPLDDFSRIKKQQDEALKKLRDTRNFNNLNLNLADDPVSGKTAPPQKNIAEAFKRDKEAQQEAAAAAKEAARERKRLLDEEARAMERIAQERAREDERQKSILSDFSSQNQSRLDDLQLELQLMGKSRKEQEKILFLREIDNEARRLGLDLTDENIAKLEKEAEAAKKKVKVVLDEIEKNKGSFSAGVGEGITKYLDDVNNLSLQASNLVMNTFQGAEDALIDLTTKGKLSFRDLADSIIADIARIAIRQSITGPLAGLLGGMFQPSGGAVGGFYGNFAQQNIGKAMSPGGFVNVTPNALGGIMTSDGPLPLNRYALGGVANSPQLALFGEGRGPEAFVPLPDGRRIPVAMQGGGNTSVVVHVNVESGSQNVTSSGQNAEALGKTIAAAVRSTLISEKRPGGLLS